jgi:hypothetical protein
MATLSFTGVLIFGITRERSGEGAAASQKEAGAMIKGGWLSATDRIAPPDRTAIGLF